MIVETIPSREPQRRIRAGRKLNGAIVLDIEGFPPLTLWPEQAFALATGILKGLGIPFEIEYEPRK